MKEYEGKTLQEVLNNASEDLKVPVEKLKYTVVSEIKSLFKKYCKISVEEETDKDYAKNYLEGILNALELKATVEVSKVDNIIHLDMTSEEDASKIIGRSGETLRALNELVRTALYSKYNDHISVLLNINNYKDHKYDKLINLAQRIASSVKRTKMSVELDPMPSDERRIIHNALADEKNIKTLSSGVGKFRHIVISYFDENQKEEKIEEESKAD